MAPTRIPPPDMQVGREDAEQASPTPPAQLAVQAGPTRDRPGLCSQPASFPEAMPALPPNVTGGNSSKPLQGCGQSGPTSVSRRGPATPTSSGSIRVASDLRRVLH